MIQFFLMVSAYAGRLTPDGSSIYLGRLSPTCLSRGPRRELENLLLRHQLNITVGRILHSRN